jgi:Xaa-Pro aminopeptidase
VSEHAQRRDKLRRRFSDEGFDAIYVSTLVNIRYLTGFTGSAGHLLLTADGAELFTDGRYRVQAAEQAPDVARTISDIDPLADLLDRAADLRLERIAFERDRLSYRDWNRLTKGLQAAMLAPDAGWIEEARSIKSETEIAAIRAAVELNAACFQAVLEHVRPEWTEIDLAAEIEREMRRRGAAGPAFDTIVAGGAHGARPHAAPRMKALGKRRLIVVDHGAILDGYVSDQTRLIAFGDPGAEARGLAKAAAEAQLESLSALRAGIAAKTADRAARNFLKGRGLDELFVHSTGHGLGLEIHEIPKLGRRESMRLRSGMVVTIEPGVYRAGVAGARVEDVVAIKPHGFEMLTPPTPSLTIL